MAKYLTASQQAQGADRKKGDAGDVSTLGGIITNKPAFHRNSPVYFRFLQTFRESLSVTYQNPASNSLADRK
jgi:hypothetical protein